MMVSILASLRFIDIASDQGRVTETSPPAEYIERRLITYPWM